MPVRCVMCACQTRARACANAPTQTLGVLDVDALVVASELPELLLQGYRYRLTAPAAYWVAPAPPAATAAAASNGSSSSSSSSQSGSSGGGGWDTTGATAGDAVVVVAASAGGQRRPVTAHVTLQEAEVGLGVWVCGWMRVP